MNKKISRIIIEIAVFALTAFFAVGYYNKVKSNYNESDMQLYNLGLIVIAAVVVIGIKALRLYIISFGKNFRKLDFLQLYIRTTLVNLFIPMKAGELYRGYELGVMFNSIGEGYLIMLFDRFIDTLGLIIVVFAAALLVPGFELSGLYLIFLIGIAFLSIFYWSFAGLYQYWNHYFVIKRSSRRTLMGLSFLEKVKYAYNRIHTIIRGKFLFILALSVLAWGIEVITFLTLGAAVEGFSVSKYLTNILTGDLSLMGLLYLCGSAAVLVVLYILVRITKALLRK